MPTNKQTKISPSKFFRDNFPIAKQIKNLVGLEALTFVFIATRELGF